MTYLAIGLNETRCFLITGQLSETDARERLATSTREKTDDDGWQAEDFDDWQFVALPGPLLMIE
jgi:hypothetical protein